MSTSLRALLPLFDQERAAGRPLALGVIVRTSGSTYGKEGTLIAFARDGTHAGMISGGCLEGDLAEHAQEVISGGQARLVHYDLNDINDSLWGLGLGCGGSVHIMLLHVGPENSWQPLSYFARAYRTHQPACAGIVCTSDSVAAGTVVLPDTAAESPALKSAEVQDALERTLRDGRARWLRPASRAFELMTIPLALPPRLLILGGGPDSLPVVALAISLGWKVTVADHRPAYADPARFPGTEGVLHAQPAQLALVLDLSGFTAAVVMSHHLDSDAMYLRALARTGVDYIGLLGPAARRDRLLAALGEQVAASLEGRLRAPVGLPIGGRGPESIALSIVAEVHAHVHGVAGIGPAVQRIRSRPALEAVAAC